MSINRLVGERVFGWSVVAASDGEPIWSNDCGTPLAFQYASAPVKFGPNFSTEIAAAWEVVEHLRKQTLADGWSSKYQVSLIDDGEQWECLIEDDASGQCWSGFDESPSLAICYAALVAFGVPDATIQEACK